MSKAKSLREQRAKLVNDARDILGRAQNQRREMTGEEHRQFDAMMSRSDEMLKEIERVERLESAERSITETRGRMTDPGQPGRQPGAPSGSPESAEYRAAFDAALRGGLDSLSDYERRALSAESTTAGGYMAAPQQFVDTVIKSLDNSVVIRQLATVVKLTTAQSLGAPYLENDPADADWTAELGTGSEDSTMSFGKRELHPSPIAKRVKVSNKLLRVAPMAGTLVAERLAYKFAVTEEKAFLTGDGAGKPLGLFTASALGIPTSRDVSTDNTTTAITADGLISAKYSLKEPYLRSDKLRWLFHRDAVKMIRKLKSSDNQYLWQPGLSSDRPDTVLDVPVVMSEYVPNTFTSGLYVGLIGDFSNYWIADAMQLTIQRLVELYAETNQVGFIGRLECDGMPVLAEAFARVKLA